MGNIPILNRVLEVITATGTAPMPLSETTAETEEPAATTMQVLTPEGIRDIDVTDGIRVIQADGTEKVLSEQPDQYDIPEDAQQRLESGTNNFLFIGKGWGHGGGISQWGIMSMANLGYTWEEIIHAYFTDVVIQPYSNLPAFAE